MDAPTAPGLYMLLTQLQSEGILITGYEVDYEIRAQKAWERRKHAVMAWWLHRHRRYL